MPSVEKQGPAPSVDLQTDRWDIAEVVARYFRLIDQKHWRDFRGLFSDDASFSHPTIGNFDDIDKAVAAVEKSIGSMLTVHQGSFPEITLLSGTEAEGTFPMNSHSVRAPSKNLVQTFGYYYFGFRRGSDAWKLTSMKLESLYRGES